MDTMALDSALIIDEQIGVCGVREDTCACARFAAELRPSGRALDLGTGTGYIALYLARRGWDVDAADVSPRAVALARRNAELNGLPVRVYVSDLLQQVEGAYDVIMFNAPMRPTENEMTRLISSLLRRSPAISRLLMHTIGGTLESDRYAFLVEVMTGSCEHLNAGGSLLLGISSEETNKLARLPGVRLVHSMPILSMPRQWISQFQFEVK